MSENKKAQELAAGTPPDQARNDRAAPARVTSRTLFGSARELIIQHDGREYRLRLTQNGKLILTA